MAIKQNHEHDTRSPTPPLSCQHLGFGWRTITLTNLKRMEGFTKLRLFPGATIFGNLWKFDESFVFLGKEICTKNG